MVLQPIICSRKIFLNIVIPNFVFPENRKELVFFLLLVSESQISFESLYWKVKGVKCVFKTFRMTYQFYL